MGAIIIDRRKMGYAGNLVPRILTTALTLLALAGCHRVTTPASVVRVADPSTAGQLIQGFYAVEGSGSNTWRWVAPKVTLALAPPANARNGARLVLGVFFPETQIEKVGPITITAFVDGKKLAPETYVKSGSYEFVRDIPACLLDTNVLPVEVNFYPYAPKSDTEARDLAAVLSTAALEVK